MLNVLFGMMLSACLPVDDIGLVGNRLRPENGK
jgi:hypothetical protein